STETVTQFTDSGEVLFSAFSSWIGTIPLAANATLSTTAWTSQAFVIDRVSLPPDAVNIRIHRVSVRLRRPASGACDVSVAVHRRTSSSSPEPGAMVGSATRLAAADIPTTAASVDVPLNGVTLSGPSDTALAIVVKGANSGSAALGYYNSLLAPADNPMLIWTTNSGSTWQPSSGSRHQNDSPFYVYGSYQSEKTQSVEVVSYTMLGLTAELV